MVASKPYRCGWVTMMLLGQQDRWASGQTTCSSVVVSGVGDLNGVYNEVDPPYGYSIAYYRAGGFDTFYLQQYGSYWEIENDDRSMRYKTNDLALHPVDIELPWADCDYNSCGNTEATLQPVLTCAEDSTSTSEELSSTCSSVVVSGVGDLNGVYNEVDPPYGYSIAYYRAGGYDTFYIQKSGNYWEIENDDRSMRYKTNALALHPVDIELPWADCDYNTCGNVAAVLQPNITCGDDAGIPEAAQSSCTSVTVSELGELDGTYVEQDPPYGYDASYVRASATDTYYIEQDGNYWDIRNDDRSIRYQTNDLALHPADISLEWVDCGFNNCDDVAAPLQPKINCERGPTPSPTTVASTIDTGASTSTSSSTPAGASIEGPTPSPTTVGSTIDTGASTSTSSSTPAGASIEDDSGCGDSIAKNIAIGVVATMISSCFLGLQ